MDTAGLWLSTIQRQWNHEDTTMPLCLQLRIWYWDAGSKGWSRRGRWLPLLHMAGDGHLYIQELAARGTGVQGGHHQSPELRGIWWLLHAHTTVDCIPGREPRQRAEDSLQVGHIQTHKTQLYSWVLEAATGEKAEDLRSDDRFSVVISKIIKESNDWLFYFH